MITPQRHQALANPVTEAHAGASVADWPWLGSSSLSVSRFALSGGFLLGLSLSHLNE